ncbi:formimidoylglutamate deiminase [Nisaea acidiphila]|uniref:Formimidoylglutamate deiminase n=1 Tax=Nisaea acidiphila TaxID=1862145 RepID=A0A9J7AQE1_9PROT|nr:formimidoylglutamate deiminase [Nisaea acidiphila]UUX48580.1 formimidoylglutamate deiminase [Nisaea acidiphila]
MTKIFAETVLMEEGWRENVLVSVGDAGTIEAVSPDDPGSVAGADHRAAVLLPAPVNLHSHAFQRAMAGLTEARGPDRRDSFWTWRRLMFRFLERLTPEHVEAIAALVQMEMLEAGYAGVAEFHYLHHQPDGTPYDDIAELSRRIAFSAAETGIGLTLLPVLYQVGGCDGRALGAGQIRFGNDMDRFVRLLEGAEDAVSGLPSDCGTGVAPHSLRAVSREALRDAVALRKDRPLHIHVAEQVAEVEEVGAAWGARPMTWLLDNHPVDERWCLIHATQMEPDETVALAKSGAVAGLCPITESSLGDGIFDGVRYREHGGRFGVGSDSNIRISLSEELRTLEYSQRLRDRGRAVLADSGRSTGRVLFEEVVLGGAQAAGRNSGRIAAGKLADMVALDGEALDLAGRTGDRMLDAFIFTGDDRWVRDVWSAGRHMVREGRHVARDRIRTNYLKTIAELEDAL